MADSDKANAILFPFFFRMSVNVYSDDGSLMWKGKINYFDH